VSFLPGVPVKIPGLFKELLYLSKIADFSWRLQKIVTLFKPS
jgi:hypothetical protein